MSFFQKARDRAQEAAAQLQQTMAGGSGGSASPGNGTAASQRGSFNVTNALPHAFRHGMANIDPRYEHNRSFHLLSGRIKSTRIEHEAMARQTKGMATATYQWGQDQLSEKREDSAGDEALADVTDRLAYIVSLIGTLHEEHAKRLEETRADLKRIQKLEVELAPRRAMRVKIHKELMTLLPERAMVHSEKVAPLEERLKVLEEEDKEKEEELGKLKREALRSSFDAQFDSLIELGEKTALVSRYGKLLLDQIPVYAPPFPSPRVNARMQGESVWPNEAQVAAIRAAVEPALAKYKPNTTLPQLPSAEEASLLSRSDTIKYAESNKQELEELAEVQGTETAIGEGTTDSALLGAGSIDASRLAADDASRRRSSSSGALMSPLPEGGSLPPNLNLEPTVLPERRPTLGGSSGPAAPPSLPPRSPYDNQPNVTSQQTTSVAPPVEEDAVDVHSATIADAGPTFAETGSPIYSTDPGPKTGTLSPRSKGSFGERKPMPPLPPELAAAAAASQSSGSAVVDVDSSQAHLSPGRMTTAQAKEYEAQREREDAQQQQAARTSIAARLRRDGSIVRRGDPDWEQAQKEQLPPYSE